ncbi:hypothetical protein AVEN_267648-1 [Araneus ventricosus]|uniref:Uncharacterized protein n=1 Tax=Araneus ventricosus TaxID=182803 RepID=A0A4Y2PK75_ARAVE|nr:hypothetical protein AVEN_267648-1 [Araneus ventricosus]
MNSDRNPAIREAFHREINAFRMHLEDLSYFRQLQTVETWVRHILKVPDKRLPVAQTYYAKFRSRLWRFAIDEDYLKQAIDSVLPPRGESIDYTKESCTLLLLMLEFRAVYNTLPVELRSRTERNSITAAKLFLEKLEERKEEHFQERMGCVVVVTLVILYAIGKYCDLL